MSSKNPSSHKPNRPATMLNGSKESFFHSLTTGLRKWWKSFADAQYHELATLILSIAAILLAIGTTLWQNSEQASIRATQSAAEDKTATLEAATRATAQYQTDKQTRLQETQVAVNRDQKALQATQMAIDREQKNLQATQTAVEQEQKDLQSTQTSLGQQLVALYRQQSSPYVKLVDPKPILTISDVTTATLEPSGMPIIKGHGQLRLILANDGGGQAGLVSIRWSASNAVPEVIGLDMLTTTITGKGVVPLPVNIEGQSASGIELQLDGEIIAPANSDGKTLYQLGCIWKNSVVSAKTGLELRFSNIDHSIEIPIEEIKLDLPVVEIKPEPPSPFTVKEDAKLGVACFRLVINNMPFVRNEIITGSVRLKGTYTPLGKITISSGSCWSFPEGSYEITYTDVALKKSTEVPFDVTAPYTITVPF